MIDICFYFQVHQPYRLRRYGVFDVGRREDYFDDALNEEVARKVATRCYLPMNALLREEIDRHEGRFRVAFSITLTAMQQFERWVPEVLESFQSLVKTGCVELLAETSHHSLSFIFDRTEFDRQVDAHGARMEELFGVRPRVFRNTELIFAEPLAAHLQHRGFSGVITEGADRILSGRSPGKMVSVGAAPDLPVLLKAYSLSDDIAFRFGNRGWSEYPLRAETFVDWLERSRPSSDFVDLFMDYETFGEHQWADTGIFDFMRALPRFWLDGQDRGFATPSEVIARHPIQDRIEVPDYISWADEERDLSAWLDNPMQKAAQRDLYALIAAQRAAGREIDEDLARLTTSDHVYYMATKNFADGDVHKYFSPYETPYDPYMAFMAVLSDLASRRQFHVPLGAPIA